LISLIIPSPLVGEGKGEGEVGGLGGETIVKQYQKTILTLTFVFSFILAGIIPIEPMKSHGQSKRQIGLFQARGKDPFQLPEGIRLLSKIDSVQGAKGINSKSEAKPIEISPLPLKVKAILISDHIRLASIDQHIVTVGDLIHDEKVLEIDTDRVILGKGDKKRTLLLIQSPIQLTVEER
jgi:hypothetical protein